MLFVFRRTRIVPITIFISDFTIFIMDNNFRFLIFSYCPSIASSFFLSVKGFSCFFIAFSFDLPFIIFRNDMLVFSHFYSPTFFKE
nr:MAG TPA: hypothetical protein [Caudoviricetes sp.]